MSRHTTEHPFADLHRYTALPRLSGLTMSPDGTRLVTEISTPNAEDTGYVSHLWELDPAGERPARQLTRSAEGESAARFTADGALWFLSKRPADPAETARREDDDAAEGPSGTSASDSPEPGLWRLPAEGGEAQRRATWPGGISAPVVSRHSSTVLATAGMLPGATDPASHARLHRRRRTTKTSGILHSTASIRFWDHDLGPAQPQLFALEGTDPEEDTETRSTAGCTAEQALRPLTRGSDHSFGGEAVLSPDGTWALATVVIREARGEQRWALARVEVGTGEVTVLDDDAESMWSLGPISPDGRRAAVVRGRRGTPQLAVRPVVEILDVSSGRLHPLAESADLWFTPLDWTPDGRRVLAQADQDGRGPLFLLDAETDEVAQLTSDDATYSTGIVAPDGDTVFAVRSSYAYPGEVVAVSLTTGEATRLPHPTERPTLPGRLTEIETLTDDDVRIRGWLALPEGAESAPAPLLLWIHGGPLNSWNAWSWRWNPWIMVEAGYAVLLPDPALSTGYGQEFIQRGWNCWGGRPYTDLMAITDAAEVRDDIDASRTAAMGGSFGGYMANWVAGHTDRFDAIVTHASLWALDNFSGTTDAPFFWWRQFDEESVHQNSPHRFVEQIVTPMLVIHGDQDYRVPINEGNRLWSDLLQRSGLPVDADGNTVHRYLYFPDENHWVLTPQNARLWYEVVLGFLADHVLGESRPLPQELGLSDGS